MNGRPGNSSLLALLGLGMLLVGGCGGGGEDEDPGAGGGGPVALLPVYDIQIVNVSGNFDLFGFAFTDALGNDLAVSMDFSTGALRGSYTLASDDITLNSAGFTALTFLGSMRIEINDDITLDAGALPGSGTFEVRVGADSIVVTLSDSQVDLSLNGGASVLLSWDEFDSLLGSLANELWQRQASLAWAVIDVMRGMINLTVEGLRLIDDPLESAGSVERMCDSFPGMPPAGALNQGMSTLTWLGSGEITNGDGFDWNFVSCWLDGGASDDFLIDGVVGLVGYSESIANNTLVSIGLESFEGLPPGGVIFNDVRSGITQESTPGTFIVPPENNFIFSGGFSPLFSEPN